MSDINFIKYSNIRNQRSVNKELKFYIVIFLSLLILFVTINIWQLYKLNIAERILEVSKKDVENLDFVIQDNNSVKDQIKIFQQQILDFETIIKANNKILDLIISITNIIPDDSYLKDFSFTPTNKMGINLPNIADDVDGLNNEYALGKVQLKGSATSKSIIEFLERLSLLEIIDNVKLVYLKYPENSRVEQTSVDPELYQSSGRNKESNLLEFSIKLLLNNA